MKSQEQDPIAIYIVGDKVFKRLRQARQEMEATGRPGVRVMMAAETIQPLFRRATAPLREAQK